MQIDLSRIWIRITVSISNDSKPYHTRCLHWYIHIYIYGRSTDLHTKKSFNFFLNNRLKKRSFCNIFTKVQKYDQDTYTWNVHRESRNTRNWFRYETFIYLLEFKVFRHEEREAQFLQQTRCTFHRPPTGLASARPKIDYLPLDSNLNSLVQSLNLNCFFFQIPKSSALPGMTSFTSPVHFLSGGFIVTSLIVTSAPHAREHLHSVCAPN